MSAVDNYARQLARSLVAPFTLPTGAGLIGYRRDAIGAQATTVQDVLQERISVVDFIPRAVWKGMLTGTIADITVYATAALAACVPGQTLYFPPCQAGYLLSPSDGAEGCLFVPVGVNVVADPGTVLRLKNTDPTVTAFISKGGNTFYGLTIDGQSLAPNQNVKDGTWLNNSQGIRAYANATYGVGAEDVTVTECTFTNLRYGIQTEGAKNWKVFANNFQRLRLSGVLHGHNDTLDCLYNQVFGNYFEEHGDTAVAYYEVLGSTTSIVAYSNALGNVAVNMNLLTAGFAYDVEQSTTSYTRQHHVLFLGNIYRNTINDVAHQRGGLVMNTVSHSAANDNILEGMINTDPAFGFADIGLSMLLGANNQCRNNQISKFKHQGMTTDGCINTQTGGNHITDCGGWHASAHSMVIAQFYDSTGCSSEGDRVTITAGYPFATAGSCAVYATASTGKVLRDLDIDGLRLDSPVDNAVYVVGLSGAHANNVNVRGLRIYAPASRSNFGGWAITMRYVDQFTIDGSMIQNAFNVFQLRDCAGGALKQTELKGSATLAICDWFGGSTGIRVKDRWSYQTVTTAINDPGTGTTWIDDNIVPLGNYANDAAAAAAGIPIGPTGRYRNNSVLQQRVA